MYQRIMVPLDGSDLAQTALPHALDLCRALGATLVLLHVRDSRQGSPEASRRFLDFTRRQHANAGVTIEVLVREGPVAETIVRAAEEERIDVVAMATHGRSGMQRVVYGSVAEQVLRSSVRPVLLVRVPGAPVEEPAQAPTRSQPSRKLAGESH
jgi:nucleotide-binding universal stress UspA family protein